MKYQVGDTFQIILDVASVSLSGMVSIGQSYIITGVSKSRLSTYMGRLVNPDGTTQHELWWMREEDLETGLAKLIGGPSSEKLPTIMFVPENTMDDIIFLEG